MVYISEDDVCKLIGYEGEHCQSCHDDHAEGYYMVDIEVEEGVYAEVCCYVAEAFDRWKEERNKNNT